MLEAPNSSSPVKIHLETNQKFPKKSGSFSIIISSIIALIVLIVSLTMIFSKGSETVSDTSNSEFTTSKELKTTNNSEETSSQNTNLSPEAQAEKELDSLVQQLKINYSEAPEIYENAVLENVEDSGGLEQDIFKEEKVLR